MTGDTLEIWVWFSGVKGAGRKIGSYKVASVRFAPTILFEPTPLEQFIQWRPYNCKVHTETRPIAISVIAYHSRAFRRP